MKYLGVDWGLKKVGLAVSEGNLASPLKSLEIKSLKDGVEKVIRQMQETNAELIVMGKPEGNMGKMVQDAYQEFQKQGINIILADETLSTQTAKEALIEMGVSRKKRHNDDAISAAIILQRFLDEQL